ncbi:hypothetical protein [Nocardioides stalactiti]|uniref:hypothetical protein n=1 Tax=Nocardioides stalactiti TaxID=2755356 RepID=UPI001600AEFB|nr:hypothetical protein [Nocardioides stalactiti]
MSAVADRTAAAPASDRTARRRVASAFLLAAGSWVGYIVSIATLTADYEQALVDASEATDTAVNRLPAETMAQIANDHPANYVTGLFLLLVPALLVLATRRASAVSGDRWGVRLAWVAAVELWFYMALNFGFLLDPLPPLTRDLDVLTVPLVTIGSFLAVAAFAVSALGLRRAGWRPVASAVAVGIAVLLTALMVPTLVTSGFDEPVPPIALFPAELVLGIALLVGRRR